MRKAKTLGLAYYGWKIVQKEPRATGKPCKNISILLSGDPQKPKLQRNATYLHILEAVTLA